MGLSTAQARLLTITARKSDCEFQSMGLSHQKIALSRDMEKISTDYQNALTQTKLVYDYYGTGTSAMDLNYGLLMTPSVYNDYYPKLVTDAKNRVVLNSAYAAAARAAGIPIEGLTGTPSSNVRNAFIEALVGENIISPAKGTTIQSIPYGNTVGIGSTVSVNTSTTDITYDELLELLETSGTGLTSVGLGSGDNITKKSTAAMEYNDNFHDMLKVIDNNGNIGSTFQSGEADISLVDLLTGENQYNYSVRSAQGVSNAVKEVAYMQRVLVGDGENDEGAFLNWMTDQFSAVLGGTNQNDAALQYAYNQVFDLLYPDDKLQEFDATHKLSTGDGKKTRKNRAIDSRDWRDKARPLLAAVGTQSSVNCMKLVRRDHQGDRDKIYREASHYIGFRYSGTRDFANNNSNRKDNQSVVSINLNSLAQAFLTSFVEYHKGVDNTDYHYAVGQRSKANFYDPDHDDFMFTMVGDTDVDTGDECLEANFYDALFNRICMNGWTENAMVDDTQYLQEMMKSGMVYISSISDDGYYYQGNYSTDSYVSEVSDDEAIARAEAKYNTEKAKIQNKEDTIDLKMKNLDTEISSLTTEYETTKNIITKSIEKTFKRYDA